MDVVCEIVQFSVEGRAAKQDPIVFALALCARDKDAATRSQKFHGSWRQFEKSKAVLFSSGLMYSHTLAPETLSLYEMPHLASRSGKAPSFLLEYIFCCGKNPF